MTRFVFCLCNVIAVVMPVLMGAAIVPVGPMYLPHPPNADTNSDPSFYTPTMNAAADNYACIVEASRACTLDKAELMVWNIGDTPDNGIRISFQDMNLTTGAPDGTQDQYRDITSGSLVAQTWTVPGLMTSNGTDGGTKRTVAAGDLFAIVVEFVTYVASDAIQFAFFSGTNVGSQPAGMFPYTMAYDFGSWTGQGGNIGNLALKCDDSTYMWIAPDWYATSGLPSDNFNSSSTPDERGLRFQFDVDTEITGVWLRTDGANDAQVILYDASNAAQRTVTLDPQVRSTGNTVNRQGLFAPITIPVGETWRVILKPTSTSNIRLGAFSVPSNAYLSATEGGVEWYYTQRTDAGAWTDTTTKRPWMGVIVSGVESGGGGSTEHSYPFTK